MGTNLWLVDKHGKGFPIQQPKMRLGRDRQSQIVIPDAQVSRCHATIWVQGGNLYIQDEHSKNGTWVNGKKIAGSHTLRIGDRIRVGGTELSLTNVAPARGQYSSPSRQSSSLGWILGGTFAVMLLLCLFTFAAFQNQPRDSVSRMVSAAQGGSVWLMDGTRVDIPPGALAADTQISISISKNPPDFGGLSPVPSTVVREFGPSGTTFLKPVQITLPYGSLDMSDALAQDAVFVARWDGKQWQYVDGTSNATRKTITAEVTGFSGYAAIESLSFNSLLDLVNKLNAKLAQGEPDPEWTKLANQIYVDPIKWIVTLQRIKNVSSVGNRRIVANKDDYYETFPFRAELPESKRNLLDAAILGHEEAHDRNGDTIYLGPRQDFDLLVEIYKQAKSRQQQEKALRLYSKFELAIFIAYFEGDFEPLNNSMKEIGEASITDLDTIACTARRDAEVRADHDGVSKASETSPQWATRLGNEDVGVQVFLVFIRAFETAPSQQIETDCEHPSGKERAEKLRELTPKGVGGLYGKVSGSTTVCTTANNSITCTETDADGLFLLAPIPSGNTEVTLKKEGCQDKVVKLSKPIPEKDLMKAEEELSFTCVPSPIQINFSADPDRINRGEYSTLRWDVKYATKVYVEDKEVATQDTLKVNPDQTTTYTLRAIGLDGKSKEVQAALTVVQPPLDIRFSTDTEQIESGKCATLQWDVKNARSVSLSSNLVSAQGSQQVCPTQTTAYTLRAEGLDGSNDSRTITIYVTIVPPVIIIPRPDTNPGGYYINFRADSTSINSGECTTLRWDVEGVRAVFLGNDGVVGHASQRVCPAQTTTYRLNVVLVNGGVVTRSVTISVSSSGSCQ